MKPIKITQQVKERGHIVEQSIKVDEDDFAVISHDAKTLAMRLENLRQLYDLIGQALLLTV